MEEIKIFYNLLKTLKDLSTKYKDLEMKQVVIELQDKYFDIKEEISNIKDTNIQLEKELESTKIELNNLRNKLSDYNKIKEQLEKLTSEENLAFDDTEITLDFEEIQTCYAIGYVFKIKKITMSLIDIFKNISLKITSPIKNYEFISAFSILCEGYSVNEKQALEIKAQFLALELLEITTNKDDEEIIKLTPKGFNEMKKLNSIKQGENKCLKS